MANDNAPTYMAFQHDGHLVHLETKVLSFQPVLQLAEDNQKVFKQDFTDEDYVVITKDTVFHPQGPLHRVGHKA